MLAKILVSNSLQDRTKKISEILEKSYGHLPAGRHGLGGGDINFKSHPDLLFLEVGEKLGIEQTRIIKEHLSYKPFQSEGRGVVIEDASLLTPEAQNALLKTLEELPENSILVMGTNSENNLLPTILSRCEIVHINVIPSKEGIQERGDWIPGQARDDKINKDIETLVNSSLEVRFEYIEKLKDKKEFLLALTKFFRQKLISLPLNSSIEKNKGNEVKLFLEQLLEAEKWINQNVNPRGILEYLMLVMPKA